MVDEKGGRGRVLVRWPTNDDLNQVACICELFSASAVQPEAFYEPVTVMLGFEWVLRSSYRFERPQILTALTALLETRELSFEEKGALERALHLYREHGGDFADCLHFGQAGAASRVPLLTFDQRATRCPGAQNLDPRLK
ncbi:type II toxin-antitoxin system VapC family toxin [Burkholderia sp. 572]|uniref:PIN domain-containing protein n=1 Tax=Burkholderia sp. 572 TaxID=3156414 RepID=UPI0033962565